MSNTNGDSVFLEIDNPADFREKLIQIRAMVEDYDTHRRRKRATELSPSAQVTVDWANALIGRLDAYLEPLRIDQSDTAKRYRWMNSLNRLRQSSAHYTVDENGIAPHPNLAEMVGSWGPKTREAFLQYDLPEAISENELALLGRPEKVYDDWYTKVAKLAESVAPGEYHFPNSVPPDLTPAWVYTEPVWTRCKKFANYELNDVGDVRNHWTKKLVEAYFDDWHIEEVLELHDNDGHPRKVTLRELIQERDGE